MATLVIRSGDAVEHEIELADRDLKIGRGDQNDVVLRDPNKTVSRFHAELRRDGAGWQLIDLNSQNGIWVGGRRQPKIALAADIPVTLGNYTLVLEQRAQAAVTPDATILAGPAPAARASDTMKRAETPGAQSAAPAAPPKAAAKPAPPRAAKPAAPTAASPGLIAFLLRLPRPVLFGSFAVVIIAILIAGQLRSASRSAAALDTAATAVPAAPAPTNAEVIAGHLSEARVLVERGQLEEAVSAHLDPILLIDPANAEALELKTRISERKAAVAAAIAPPAAPAATSPAVTTLPVAPAAAGVGRAAAPSRRPAAPRGPSEVLAESAARERELADRYDRARAAVGAGTFDRALPLLNELQRDRPNFRDVPQLLARVREGLQSQAQQAMTEGARLEGTNDLAGALAQFERAAQLDPATGPAAAQAETRVRDRMKTDGADAFRRARQYDALGRVPEAVALYERAVRYLDASDPNREAARARLEVLRARP